jgi:hypothetical protein
MIDGLPLSINNHQSILNEGGFAASLNRAAAGAFEEEQDDIRRNEQATKFTPISPEGSDQRD